MRKRVNIDGPISMERAKELNEIYVPHILEQNKASEIPRFINFINERIILKFHELEMPRIYCIGEYRASTWDYYWTLAVRDMFREKGFELAIYETMGRMSINCYLKKHEAIINKGKEKDKKISELEAELKAKEAVNWFKKMFRFFN